MYNNNNCCYNPCQCNNGRYGNYGYGSILEPYGICGSKVIYGKDNSPFHYVLAQ